MTREEALEIVAQPSLTDNEVKELFAQITEKLQILEEELQSYLNMPLWENTYKNSNTLYTIGQRMMMALGFDTRVRK